jgi:hypothetical protein
MLAAVGEFQQPGGLPPIKRALFAFRVLHDRLPEPAMLPPEVATVCPESDSAVAFWNGGRAGLHQSRHRFHVGAAREHGRGKPALIDTQMFLQQPLEHGAQVGGRLKVAAFVEVGLL